MRRGQGAQSILDQGIFFEPLLSLYRKLKEPSRSLFVQIVTGSVFTNFDFYQYGYLADPICTECGEGVDSVFHRCYSCPMVEARAKRALGETLFNDIIAAGETGLMGTRCIAPQPISRSLPSDTQIIRTINMYEGDTFDDDDVYGDGSCSFPTVSVLRRAGFALVQVDPEGALVRAVYGTLPPHYPQTPLAAEYAAFSAGTELCRNANFVGDCAEVIRSYRLGHAAAVKGTNPFADFWKALHRTVPHWERHVSAITKVKAHKTLEDVQAARGNVKHFWGNFEADRLAKEAVDLHPCQADDVKQYKKARRVLHDIAHHMLDTLSDLHLKRATQEKFPRLPNGFKAYTRDPKLGHRYVWNGSFWYCNVCCFRSSSPLPLGTSRDVCVGYSPFDRLREDSRGHKLYVAFDNDDSSRVIFCFRCWAYGTAYPRQLRSQCTGAPGVEGSSNKFYLVRGKHPASKLPFSNPMRLR